MPGPRNRGSGRFKGGIIRGGAFTRGSRGAAISGGQAGTLGLGRGYGNFLRIAPGMTIGMQYVGFRKLNKMFAGALMAGPALADKRLTAMVLEVYNRSQELVPVSSGNLKRSGFIQLVGKNRVEIGYSADYAVEVHETHPTAAKFLEKPFRDVFRKFERHFDVRRDSNAVFLGVRV